jgi:hypothetical protein
MTRFLITIVAVAASVAVGSTAYAGGPPPMYVVVEEVVLESGGDGAERIIIQGSFIRQKERGTEYDKPVAGYMSFTLDKDKAAACRTEWNKWEKAAGTGKVVAVGMCGAAGSFLTEKIHESNERLKDAGAIYTPGHISAIDPPGRGDFANQAPVKALLAFVKERADAQSASARSVRP